MPEKRKRRAPSDKSNHTHAVSAEERGAYRSLFPCSARCGV